MCSLMAAAVGSASLSIAGNYLGQRSQAKGYQQYMDAMATGRITEMNHAAMNYNIERQDAFDAAVQEQIKIYQNAQQLNSQVKAAVNENMTGRTANMIVRNVEGDTARAAASVQENFDRKSNEIDLNIDTEAKSTEAYLKNLNASAPKMPSRFTNFISSAAIGLNAYTNGKNLSNQQKIIKAQGGKG